MSEASVVVVKPENILPVDALHVLQEKMLDCREYGSCSKPVAGSNIGCPAFDRCERPDKGQGRPVMGGVRIVKSKARGGDMREDAMPCFVYWQRKEAEEISGTLMDWVAEEGEEVTIKCSKPTSADATGKPLPGSSYFDTFDTIKVPEFKGLSQNLKLVNAAYQAEIMKKHHEKKRAEMRENAMAPPAGSVVPGTPNGDDKPKRR